MTCQRCRTLGGHQALGKDIWIPKTYMQEEAKEWGLTHGQRMCKVPRFDYPSSILVRFLTCLNHGTKTIVIMRVPPGPAYSKYDGACVLTCP